jgi:hypothetical protein
MKIQTGQVWTIHRGAAPHDPIVIEVLGVDAEGYPFVRTTLRSAPRVEIERRRHMHPRDLTDSALLESGPGTGPNRSEQIAHAKNLISYAAEREGVTVPEGVALDVTELLSILVDDHDGDRVQARVTLRAALAELGGTERDAHIHDYRTERVTTRTTLVLPRRAA